MILSLAVGGIAGMLVMGWSRKVLPKGWGEAIGSLLAVIVGFIIGMLSIRMGIWD